MQRNTFKSLVYLLLSAAVLLIPALTHAQQVVPPGLDAGSILEQEKRLAPLHLPPTPPSIIKPGAEKAKPDLPGALRVRVKEIRLSGTITRFSPEALLGLVKDLIGREVALQELQQAVDRITAHYREKGYFLARAVLAQQDITEGRIIITILEGALEESPVDGGVRINGTKLRLGEERIREIIRDTVPEGKALHQGELERGLLTLNDMPGIAFSANLEPGASAGSTRLVIDVTEGPLLNPYAMFDNFGNRFTGSYRATAGLNLNDPTGSGDQLSFSGNKSVDGDYYYVNAAYLRPVGSSGLVLGLSYNQLAYELGKELKDLQSKGEAKDVTLIARYPLLRNRFSNLFLNAAYDAKWLNNNALGTEISDKRVNVAGIGLTWYGTDGLWGGGVSQAGFTVNVGDLDLGKVRANRDADQASARTNGAYRKMVFNATRLQRVTETVNVSLTTAGQLAGKNLDSSEKFILGGPTGVRAYPVSEAIGDNGMKGSAEIKWNAVRGTWAGDVQFISFYDIGYIHQYYEVWPTAGLTTPNDYTIQGAGVGAALGKPGKFDVRIQYAWKIGSNPGQNAQGNDSDGKSENGRVWLSVSAFF